jgi:hypothetical protein
MLTANDSVFAAEGAHIAESWLARFTLRDAFRVVAALPPTNGDNIDGGGRASVSLYAFNDEPAPHRRLWLEID